MIERGEWRNAVRERCGNIAPGRYADVDVEILEIEAGERIGKGEQCPNLVDAAERAAAGDGEPDAGTCACKRAAAIGSAGCVRSNSTRSERCSGRPSWPISSISEARCAIGVPGWTANLLAASIAAG